MRLMQFEDVHPDWNIVRSFGADETRSLLKLLVTAMLLDGRITVDERETLIDEFARLPVAEASIDTEEVKRMVRSTEVTMRRIRSDPAQFGPYLEELCGRIGPEHEQIAALRLITMLALSGRAAEIELNFCRTVGYRFGLPEETVDAIVKATWELTQRHLAHEFASAHRDPRPMRSAPHFGERERNPDDLRSSEDEDLGEN